MARIKLIDRADMNVEQGRVYDAAKAANGPVGGPYYAYIRLPKLFEASQNLRGTLAAGPLSRREQQMIHLAVARHWGAKYPWFAQVRASLTVGIDQAAIDAINARKEPNISDARERACFTLARELLANKGLSDATYTAAEKALGEEHLVAAIATVGNFSMTCMTAKTFGIDPPAENPTPLSP
jgi:4-carboxymuconolactone decarboxylase